MAKKDIKYGKEELIDGDLDIKESKVRITTMVDFMVLENLRAEASHKGIGYQTLINMILNEHVKGEFMARKRDATAPSVHGHQRKVMMKKTTRKKAS